MYWCKGKTNNIGYTSYDSNMILYDFLFISPFKILISVGMLKDVEDELQRKVKVSLDFSWVFPYFQNFLLNIREYYI